MGKLVRLKDFFMPLEPPDQLHLQGADGFQRVVSVTRDAWAKAKQKAATR